MQRQALRDISPLQDPRQAIAILRRRRGRGEGMGGGGGSGSGGGGSGVTGPAGPGGEYWNDVIVQQHFSRDGFTTDTSPSGRAAGNTGSVAVNGTTNRAEFNGSSQRIRVAPTASTPDDFNWSGDFAFEMWNFEVLGTGDVYPLSYYDASDGQRRWRLWWRPDGDAHFRIVINTAVGSGASEVSFAVTNPGIFDTNAVFDYLGVFRNGSNFYCFYQENGGPFTSLTPFFNSMGTNNPGSSAFIGKGLLVGAINESTPQHYPFELEAYRITNSARGVSALGDLTSVPDKDFATSAS